MKSRFVNFRLRKQLSILRSLPLLGILLFGLAQIGCSTKGSRKSSQSQNCVERRAIFDIGSGSTKLKVADINFCESRVVRVVFEKAKPVDYASDLSRSPSGLLSTDVRKAGAQAIQELVDLSKRKEPAVYSAIMTGVFRKASNADAFRLKLQKQFGFKFRIVTQDLEARYGFESVRASSKIDPEKLVVWDIGGSTMQFVSKKGGVWVMDLKDLASVSFKEKFIRDIQKKNPKKVYSPNPVGETNFEKGILLARRAAKHLNTEMKFELSESGVSVIGIGGVHRFSIAGQTGRRMNYDLSHVRRALLKQVKKNDLQVGGEYAATEVTNLMLVAGFLEELSIRSVIIGKADIQDGVLLSKDVWKK